MRSFYAQPKERRFVIMKVRFIAQAPEQFTGELRLLSSFAAIEEKWVYCQHRQREEL